MKIGTVFIAVMLLTAAGPLRAQEPPHRADTSRVPPPPHALIKAPPPPPGMTVLTQAQYDSITAARRKRSPVPSHHSGQQRPKEARPSRADSTGNPGLKASQPRTTKPKGSVKTKHDTTRTRHPAPWRMRTVRSVSTGRWLSPRLLPWPQDKTGADPISWTPDSP